MTLAVTGGTGFVGRHLLRIAAEQGLRVKALARRPQASLPHVEWIEGALDRPDSLATLAQGADAVIHVAGVISAPDKLGFDAGNVAGTAAMVTAAREAGARRLVHVSSLAAREPDLSLYGASKLASEAIVRESGVDWTIVRPPAVYGPGDREMLELFRMAKRGLMPLPPGGRLSLIEVGDLARLLLALVPAQATFGQVYEPDDATPEGWDHRDLARAIGDAVGRRVVPLPIPQPMLRAIAAIDGVARGKGAKLTPDRVRYFCHPDWVCAPGAQPPKKVWSPIVPTRDGLKATAESYRAAGWL